MKRSRRNIGIILVVSLIGVLFESLLSYSKSYNKELAGFKRKNPRKFNIIESKPFVITGNIGHRWMKRIVKGTIIRCSNALYNDFIDKKPSHLIKIYLFKDGRSYIYYSKKLFDDTPDTPYGFYLPSSRSLVMNISTGGGTLVHELTHALIEVDFPDIPAWFNEGMGSLFEACTCGDDHIYGLLNWRLPILQKGIKKGDFVPLRKVLSTSIREFYKDEKNMHYGEARYFCLYMQEKKVLRKFYRLFRDNYRKDHTGLTFVEQLFGGKKIEIIERDWLKWVKRLRYMR